MAEPGTGNLPCRLVVAGGETYCASCGLRWDTNDPEPPACPKENEPPKREPAIRYFRN